MSSPFSPVGLLAFPILVFVAGAAEMSSETPEEDYRELVKEHRAAMEGFHAQLAKLHAAGDADVFENEWSPLPTFVQRFAEAAETYAGTEGAVPFLIWILQNERGAEPGLPRATTAALDTLLESHPDDDNFRRTIRSGGYLAYRMPKERCIAILEHVEADAPDEELALFAVLGRGAARVIAGDMSDEDRVLSREDLAHVQETASEESGLIEEAAGFLFELENLQIGQTAPDIEGNDLGGVAFKLSDYRGKVVLLDFWGDW